MVSWFFWFIISFFFSFSFFLRLLNIYSITHLSVCPYMIFYFLFLVLTFFFSSYIFFIYYSIQLRYLWMLSPVNHECILIKELECFRDNEDTHTHSQHTLKHSQTLKHTLKHSHTHTHVNTPLIQISKCNKLFQISLFVNCKACPQLGSICLI